MSKLIRVSICKKYIDENHCKLECDVDWAGEKKVLWVKFSEDLSNHVDEKSSDWVAVALLVPAMLHDLNLHVEGSLSPLIFQYMNSDIQTIVARQNSKLNKIEVTCNSTEIRTRKSDGYSGVGFSAGVDSFSSLALLDKQQELTTDYLATFNVGALGGSDIGREMLKKYASRLHEYTKIYNKKAFILDSNISDFYSELPFQLTHTIRGAAAVLSVGSTFRSYFYSSTFEYSSIGVKETYDMSYADPILLPLLSNEVTQLRAIGTPLSRLEKVHLVLGYVQSYKYLDVCVRDVSERLKMSKPNCSKCWKCTRQLITLDLFGALSKYKDVFDLDYYEMSIKEAFFNHTMVALSKDRTNDSDVLRLAQKKGLVWNVNFDNLIKLASISWKIKKYLAKILTHQFIKNR